MALHSQPAPESRRSGARIEAEAGRGVARFGERTGSHRAGAPAEAETDRRINGVRMQAAGHRGRMRIEAGEG